MDITKRLKEFREARQRRPPLGTDTRGILEKMACELGLEAQGRFRQEIFETQEISEMSWVLELGLEGLGGGEGNPRR